VTGSNAVKELLGAGDVPLGAAAITVSTGHAGNPEHRDVGAIRRNLSPTVD